MPVISEKNTSQSISKHSPFLMQVKHRASLENLYDAQEITEIVYRVMRDLMNHTMIEQVSDEMNSLAIQTSQQRLNGEISELWQDSNPLVRWLSHIRPAFDQEGPLGIDDQLFLKRVEMEGALPVHVAPLTAVSAVFAATKPELTPETQRQVANCLPGIVKTVWVNA